MVQNCFFSLSASPTPSSINYVDRYYRCSHIKLKPLPMEHLFQFQQLVALILRLRFFQGENPAGTTTTSGWASEKMASECDTWYRYCLIHFNDWGLSSHLPELIVSLFQYFISRKSFCIVQKVTSNCSSITETHRTTISWALIQQQKWIRIY